MDTWNAICDGEIIAKTIDQVIKCSFRSFQFRYKSLPFLAQQQYRKDAGFCRWTIPRESNTFKVRNKYFYIFGRLLCK